MNIPEKEKISLSAFVGVFGPTSSGKSSLINRLVGQHVSATARSNNTTRSFHHAILTRENSQIVLMDTPGISASKSLLSKKLRSATHAQLGVEFDAALYVIDGTKRVSQATSVFAKELIAHDISNIVVVVNKIDLMSKRQVLDVLEMLYLNLPFKNTAEYVPVSAITGENCNELIAVLDKYLGEGSPFYEKNLISNQTEDFYLCELIREELLRYLYADLPESVAVQIVERDGNYVKCDISVKSKSQIPIVLGKNAENLRTARNRVLKRLRQKLYLDLRVKHDPKWIERFYL